VSAASVNSPAAPAALIAAEEIHTHYGPSHVLQGVSLYLGAGESVGLLGRNGMGKTTLLRTLLGLKRASRGTVMIRGRDVTAERPDRIARLGIGYVPEGRQIFPNLSVRENLVMAARAPANGVAPWTLARTLATFPRLQERLAHGGQQLSGGEQQMLAIGRALMSKPKFLMMDEPSLGIAPLLVKAIFEKIVEINRTHGITILLVEQNANLALEVSHYGYVLETGKIILQNESASLRADPKVRSAYLGG
jgi:branched-chain amino acid transport system ATP-binding protein